VIDSLDLYVDDGFGGFYEKTRITGFNFSLYHNGIRSQRRLS